MRIPNPLEVVEYIGDSSADKVRSENLALTKLNWNNRGFHLLVRHSPFSLNTPQ